MRCTCSLEKLQEAVTLAERIAGRNTTLPILSYVKLSAKNNKLVVCATNLEIGVEVTLNTKIKKDGEIVVPANILNHFLAMVKGEEQVDLEVSQNTLTIITGEHKTKIKGGEGKNFPIIPQKKTTATLTLNTHQLTQILQKTIFATTTNETRPELTGVFLAFDERGIRAAATDSFRLAQSISHFPKSTPQNYSAYVGGVVSTIIPKNTCQELLHILPKAQTLTFTIEKNQLFTTIDNTTIVSRIIEGTYPNYQQIIPQNHVTKIIVEKEALLNAVKIASVFTKNKAPEFILVAKEKALVISAEAQDTGSATTTIPAKISGESNEAVLNAQYVVEGVALYDTTNIEITLTTNTAPVVFRPASQGAEAADFLSEDLYIVMPIKNTTQ